MSSPIAINFGADGPLVAGAVNESIRFSIGNVVVSGHLANLFCREIFYGSCWSCIQILGHTDHSSL